MGTMRIMGTTGDTKLIWDADNTDETDAARRMFTDLRGKGFLAFRVVGEKGRKGEQITTFDADAERIIMAPPMVGG